MKNRIIYILILIAAPKVTFCQQHDDNQKDNANMNRAIVEELIEPVRLELETTTILDGRDDSWWNTPEYWDEKELDGIRSVIFYSISDSTKVLAAINLLLEHDDTSFKYHNEVSSLLVKVAHLFPSECLDLLNRLLEDYKRGMKIFDPYGDVIYRFLFERLDESEKDNLQKNMVKFLRAESFEFLNWSPIFNVLYRNGDIKYLKEVIRDNQHRFEPIDSKGYYSVIIQAKAKVNGTKVYPELINIIKQNPNNESRIKFALFAMQAISRNHKLTEIEIDSFCNELSKCEIPEELKKLHSQTLQNIKLNE